MRGDVIVLVNKVVFVFYCNRGATSSFRSAETVAMESMVDLVFVLP